MRRRWALLMLLGLVAAAAARPADASCTFPFNLQNGQTADAGQVMADLNAIVGCMGTVQRSYLAGLTLSNDGTSPNGVLDIAAGMAADSSNATYIALSSALAKATQGAWAAGNNSNGMGNGLTVAANTWYHVFAIVNGGSADVYFDTSPTAANAPSGTTAFRRIGSFKTDGSAHILAFTQNGDEFLWNAAVVDYNAVTFTTSAVLKTLSVPTGVKVNATGILQSMAASDNNVMLVSPDAAPTTYTALVTNISSSQLNSAYFNVRTNISGQVNGWCNTGTNTVYISTTGWIDRRGRDL
jgi:hypothetical protein